MTTRASTTKRAIRERQSFAWASTRFLRSSVLFLAVLLVSPSAGCGEKARPTFSQDSAWQFLLDQCAFGPRPPRTPAHSRTTRYLVEKLQAQGATVNVQNFEIQDPYRPGLLPVTNVIGSFLPERKKRVMLCAHYDTRPRADQETADSLKALPIMGANDGASGVAVLLEVGRLISGQAPREIGVDIVFFDAEDYGREGDLKHYLIGSKYFAANLAGYRPECAILLDMVAGRDAKIRQEGNSRLGAPELVDDLFARAARLGLDVFVPEPYDPIIDDHVPLLRAGIPAVDLIGLPYEHWHKVSDVPENCDPAVMGQVGALIVDFLYDFTYESKPVSR